MTNFYVIRFKIEMGKKYNDYKTTNNTVYKYYLRISFIWFVSFDSPSIKLYKNICKKIIINNL